MDSKRDITRKGEEVALANLQILSQDAFISRKDVLFDIRAPVMVTINLGRTMENPYMFMLCPFFSRICSRRKPSSPAEEPFKAALHLKSPPGVFICRVHLSTDKICCWPDALTTTGRTVGHGVVPELISHVSCSARVRGPTDTRES